MSKQIEALKLALEGLEYIHEGANNQGPHTGISWRCVSNKAEPAITAIREALAEQPAQTATYTCGVCGVSMQMEQPAQQQQEPPTVAMLLCLCGAEWEWRNRDWELVATPTAQQEPVSGIVLRNGTPTFVYDWHIRSTDERLYTSPTQRKPWVGLTAMEIEAIGKSYEEKDRSIRAWGLFACAIEIKLREKNA